MADRSFPNRPVEPPPFSAFRIVRWMLGLGALAVVLSLAAIGLFYWLLPGEIVHAQQREIPGGVELTIQSDKQAWITLLSPACSFGIFALVFWKFRDRLQIPYQPQGRHLLASPTLRRVLLAVLCVLLLLVWIMGFIVSPQYDIQRITIVGDQVRLESLYRSWQVPREEFQRVEIQRDVRTQEGETPVAEYQARLHRPSGLPFWTSTITAGPPDGLEDRHYQQFFARLEEELVGGKAAVP